MKKKKQDDVLVFWTDPEKSPDYLSRTPNGEVTTDLSLPLSEKEKINKNTIQLSSNQRVYVLS